MKLEVLPQKLHGGEISSIDINSTNKIVATGGKDNIIALWNLESLINADVAEKNHALQLSPEKTIEVHKSPVTCARWSPTENHVLISGDRTGHIYISDTSNGTSILVYPWPSIEDEAKLIIDGSWSKDGRLFAWSTSDFKVHIYDTVKRTYQVLLNEVKDEKTSIQRSIAFDPSNTLLVTIGDDTLVHIYQYHYVEDSYQFKVLCKISKLMNNNATDVQGLNHRKISWSCDGEFFSVPNASKQQAALISLLSKSQDWENKISLVGHDMECDVVQFAPHIYQSEPEVVALDTDRHNIYHVIASAGLDRTLVLWNTSKESPVLVLRDITEKPIADLCWDTTGERLLFVTMDGHLGVVGFERGELGDTIASDLLSKLKESQDKHSKPFSCKSDVEASNSKKTKHLTDLIEQSKATNVLEAFKKPKVTEDIETEERKPEEPTVDDIFPSKLAGDIIPTVITASRADNTDDVDMLQSAMREREQPPNVSQSRAKGNTVAVKEIATSLQRVSIKNGKKRIQPVLMSNGQKTSTSMNDTSALLQNHSQTSMGLKTGKTLMEFDKPSYSVTEEAQKENKKHKVLDESGSTKKAKRNLIPIKFVGSVVLNPSTTFAKVRLSAPKIRMFFGLTSRESADIYLDIKNGQGNETAPSRVTCFKRELQIWTDFIPKYIQLASEGSNFWAISTADGQILTYSRVSGKRLLPPLIMGAPLSFLESHGKYLMAVTTIAEVFVWDMEQKKLHMSSPLSLASLLDLNNKFEEDTISKSENVTMCSITSKGMPLVTLSNGAGYLYNIDMGVWNTISEAWWAFGSHYWDSISDDKTSIEPQSSELLGREAKSSLIGLMEHKTNEEILRKSRVGRGKYFNKISKNMIMKEGYENLENTVSLSHLENRILCCEILGEEKDFHDFLIIYVKRICELGLKAKLFEICEQLLASDNLQQPKICGYDKQELLKEIILSCAEYRDSQRILVHFSKILGIIDSDY